MKLDIKDREVKMYLECRLIQERQNIDINRCLRDYKWIAG
jgi:hypothetical protein